MMARIEKLTLFLILVGISVGQAWADLAPGRPPKKPDPAKPVDAAPLTIQIDRNLAQSRIEIPSRFLVQSPGLKQSSVGFRRGIVTDVRERTILAGMALSLLVIGGGLVTVFIRRRQGRAAIATAVTLAVVLSLCVSVSFGDLVVPGSRRTRARPVPRPLPSVVTPHSEAALSVDRIDGGLVVQPTPYGDRVVLRIGRDLADKLSKATEPTAATRR